MIQSPRYTFACPMSNIQVALNNRGSRGNIASMATFGAQYYRKIQVRLFLLAYVLILSQSLIMYTHPKT